MTGEENSLDSEEKEAERQRQVDEILAQRFQRVDLEHPAMKALYKEARRHWLEQEDLVER